MTGSVSFGCYSLWIFGMTEINEIKSSGKNGLFIYDVPEKSIMFKNVLVGIEGKTWNVAG